MNEFVYWLTKEIISKIDINTYQKEIDQAIKEYFKSEGFKRDMENSLREYFGADGFCDEIATQVSEWIYQKAMKDFKVNMEGMIK